MICGEIAFFTLNEWCYRKGFDSLKSTSLKWFHSSIQSQFHLDDREHCDGLTRRKKFYLILTEMFLGASNKCQRPRVICGSYNRYSTASLVLASHQLTIISQKTAGCQMCESSVKVCIKYDRLSPATSAQDDKQSEDQVVSCDEESNPRTRWTKDAPINNAGIMSGISC